MKNIGNLFLYFVFFSLLSLPVCGLQSINQSETLLDTGKTLVETGNYENSILIFDEILKNQPDSLSAYNNKAVALYRLGNCQEAAEVIKKGLEYYPMDSGLLINGALIAICSNDNEHLLDLLNRLNSISVEDASLWFTIGLIQRDLGNLSGSLEAFSNAIQINETYGDAWAEKASILTEMGRYDEAYLAIQNGLNLSSDVTLLYNRGVIEERMGRIQDAVNSYNGVTQRDPSHYKAFFNLGSIYWNHYRLNESLDAFDKVTKIYPNFSDAWFFKGLTLKEMNKINESVNAFAKAAELAPSNKMFQAYAHRYQTNQNTSLSKKGIVSLPFYIPLISLFVLILSIITLKKGRNDNDAKK